MMSNPIGETIDSPSNQPRAAHADQRQSPRFTLRDGRATLSWHEGPDRIAIEAVVVDLSGGGSAVLVARSPAVDQSVWFRLECGSVKLEPWQARTLGSSADTSGNKLVRLQFASWIPLGTILEQNRDPALSQRHAVCETRATLSWMENDDPRKVPGQLLNISGLDAAVRIDAEPPSDQPIWFALECGTPEVDPIESRLIFASRDPSGSKIARLQFVAHCPRELFELAVHGRR